MIQKILGRKPDFIIHLGDMVRKPDAKLWDSFFELSEPIGVPFFPVVGITMCYPPARGRRPTESGSSFPKTGRIIAFVLMGLLRDLGFGGGAGEASERSRDWLEQQISSSKEAFKLMFLHRPLFLPSTVSRKGRRWTNT